MACKGLWIPSKIPPKIPGPNSTDSGFPVLNTGSPTVTPAIERNHKIIHSLMNNVYLIDFFSIAYMYPHKLAGWPCHLPNE